MKLFEAAVDFWGAVAALSIACLKVSCACADSARQALAVGCGLNARGILGMVMAAAAYEAELIDLRLFVACVLMCVITTMAAGPALHLILGRPIRAQAASEGA